MFAIYILITCLSGYALIKRIGLLEKETILLRVIFSMGIGVLFMGWMTYLFSYAVSIIFLTEDPMLYGNLISCLVGILIIWTEVMYEKSRILVSAHAFLLRIRALGGKLLLQVWEKYWIETIFFLLLLIFFSCIFYYVFYTDQENLLHAGATVFSDYAPHTAMMRSFSSGGNFPTEYPHFGGEDIRYHFMFQFFCGNLEYLGMSLDHAYNIPSIFSLWSFMVFLYHFGIRLSGNKIAGILSVLFLLFRSSFSFFVFVFEHLQKGDLLSALAGNSSFIGYTVNESWGLWNFNVYLNQRHLGLGLLIGAGLIWIFMDYIEDSDFSKNLFFSKEAWGIRDLKMAVCLGITLGSLSFWNGAVVIATLLILFGFAIFSYRKLDYLIVAGITILLSEAQVSFFMDGGKPRFSFFFGFLAENRTLGGVAEYLVLLTGIFFIGVILMLLLFKGRKKYIVFAFLLPSIFAFTISMTEDITVNHKYIMISMVFEGVMWAYAIARLIRRKDFRSLAAVLIFLLTITGVFDMITIFRANGKGKEIVVDMDSNLTKWLQDKVKPGEIILTPPYSMNEVTLSGRILYCGWPYYAWSAGYDTDSRTKAAQQIYGGYVEGNNTNHYENSVKTLVLSENISYILTDESVTYDRIAYSSSVVGKLYPLVYEEGEIGIYAVKNEQ